MQPEIDRKFTTVEVGRRHVTTANGYLHCLALASLMVLSPILARAQMTMPSGNLCDPTSATTTVVRAGQVRVLNDGADLDCLRIEGGEVRVADNATVTLATLDQVGGTFTLVGSNAHFRIKDVRPRDIVDQFSTGMVVQGGTFRMEGTPKTAIGRLAAEVLAGSSSLSLAFDPLGWVVGDRILVLDSRDYFASAYGALAGTPRPEICTVAAVAGRTVTCTQPFTIEHPGARSCVDDACSGYKVEWYPPVGNLSRSVTIRSVNPKGVRGHIMFTMGADVTLRYVDIDGMGRTTNDPLDPVTNAKGRYALHIHFLDRPARIEGNVVEHASKWGPTVHHSNGSILRDNIAFDTWGAGFMTEDGTERDNVFEHNLSVLVNGTGQRGDERSTAGEFGVNGSAFWFNGPFNITRGNIGSDGLIYGFTVWGEGCLAETSDNEIWGGFQGLSLWYTGATNCTSYVDGFKAFHHQMGNYGYPTTNVVMRDFVSRNDPRVRNVNDPTNGWGAGDYTTIGGGLLRPDIQHAKVAVYPSSGIAGATPNPAGHTFIIEDARFNHNQANVAMAITGGSYQPHFQVPQTVIVRNARHGTLMPGWYALSKSINPSASTNLISSRRFIVENDNGVAGATFEIFDRLQAPNAVVPDSGIGSPEPGLTNAQTWAKYHVAVAGAVAPCDTVRPNVYGFACPTGAIAPARLPTPKAPAGGRE